MNADGIITLVSYAQYFNNQTDDCTNNQDWTFPFVAGSMSLPLSQDNRNKFNTLVVNTNAKLRAAVSAASATAKSRIVYSEWDGWGQAVAGQFCEPGSSPYPDDSSNSQVLFYKLATPKVFNPGTLYRRDEEWTALQSFSNVTTADAEDVELADGVTELGALVARMPAPPACPKSAFSGWLPDSIGRIFHPNNLGHEAIASFALWDTMNTRASALNVSSPACAATTDLICLSASNWPFYCSPHAIYANIEDFCRGVARSPLDSYAIDYYYNTPDEYMLQVFPGTNAAITLLSCTTAFEAILDGCDSNNASNPMNWKFGGSYKDTNGNTTYQILTQGKVQRPFPIPTAPKQTCDGHNSGLWDTYHLKGAGWATWDWGQHSLLTNTSNCIGSTPTHWYFKYYDQPDPDGYQWEASFRTPVWTRARCFNNNKVQGASGGPGSNGGGCSGNG